ncbi:MAG TPA: hypothetical protein VNA68_00425 [Candidatus Dormibacteraeota bacterium]|nr:hypothetical protein [Candidatus Dormibacteraeota bacterium]
MKNLLLHPSAAKQLQAVLAHPGGSVLLHGQAGIGKYTASLAIAKELNCRCRGEGSCPSCKLAAAGAHPDIITLSPDEKGKIGIEAIQGLQRQLALAKYRQFNHRAVIIRGAELMTLPAQNALLKTLEEPPPGTLMILTSDNKSRLLPTVISRCRVIYIPPIEAVKLQEWLIKTHALDQNKAGTIAALAGASVGLASTYITDSKALDRRIKLEESATSLLTAALHERLIIAADMANQKLPVHIELASLLVTKAKIRIRQQPSQESAADLEAVESFIKRLRANVQPRAALEALAVELSC